MKKIAIAVLLSIAAYPLSAAPQKRCGWVHNPTPGNWWLVDRNGEWTIATQGGREAPGVEKLPEFNNQTWVKTNGYYGYGCGCMTVDTSRKNGDLRITRIYSGSVQPLRVCRADQKLPKP